VLEYLYKPLTAEIVAQHFGPVVVRRPRIDLTLRGGRVLAVTGVRGGVGGTTIAVNLAWMLAQVDRRYTALVDADLYTGTASLMLNVEPGAGLKAALERPERVDELFVERAARPVGERLHVLASEEGLADPIEISLAGPERLVSTLRRRYNFVVIDAPLAARSGPLRSLPGMADQRILVMEPSLASLRDTLRLLSLPASSQQVRRPFVVLNRAGRRGGLTLKQVEEGLLQKPDLIIPDLSGKLGEAATLGEPAASKMGSFRTAIATLARELTAVSVATEPKRFRLALPRWGKK
jgi:pilus assembly protein CpaE